MPDSHGRAKARERQRRFRERRSQEYAEQLERIRQHRLAEFKKQHPRLYAWLDSEPCRHAWMEAYGEPLSLLSLAELPVELMAYRLEAFFAELSQSPE